MPPTEQRCPRSPSALGGEVFEVGDSGSLEEVYEQLGSRVGARKERRQISLQFVGGALVLLLGRCSAACAGAPGCPDSQRILSFARTDPQLRLRSSHQRSINPRRTAPMLNTPRKTLTAIATVSAFAAAGAALAGAATSTNPSSSSSSSTQRPADDPLAGETADKVTATALAEVPGGTVLRVEAGGPHSTRYHAHVRRSDGTEVVVLVNASFEATSVEEHRKRP